MLAERDPRRDRRDDRLERRGETHTRGRDEPHRRERERDRDALDRLVIDERDAREANDTEDDKQRKVRSLDPQVVTQCGEDRNEHKESEEDTPLREDGWLHTRVECRLRDNPADTEERGCC